MTKTCDICGGSKGDIRIRTLSDSNQTYTGHKNCGTRVSTTLYLNHKHELARRM